MTYSASRSKVFVSYGHADRRFLGELKDHLEPEIRAGVIDVWDDTRIEGGHNWREDIRKALAQTRVAVCLVSRHFRKSRFIAEHELPPLLAAAKADGLVILPVVVGKCDFESSEFGDTQAFNSPSRPLNSMRPYQRDEIWVKLVRRIIDELGRTEGPKISMDGTPEVVPSIWDRQYAAEVALGAWLHQGLEFFTDRLKEAFPGVRGLCRFADQEALARLTRLLREPLRIERDGRCAEPLWRWRGYRNM